MDGAEVGGEKLKAVLQRHPSRLYVHRHLNFRLFVKIEEKYLNVTYDFILRRRIEPLQFTDDTLRQRMTMRRMFHPPT